MDLWWWLIVALITVAFCGYVFYLWQIGRFKRTFWGMRIVSWMIAMELFGLFIMVMALILFFVFPGYETFVIADLLLGVGLLFAVPPLLYLMFYFLSTMLASDDINYKEEAKAVDNEWFEINIAEREESSNKAEELIARLESEIALLTSKVLELANLIQTKDEQIAILLSQGQQSGVVDTEALATLEREKLEIEIEHAAAKQNKQEASYEKEEIQRERELLDAERARLEEDRKKFEELTQAKEQMEANALTQPDTVDAKLLFEYEKQIQALKEEQIRKSYEVEAELDVLRAQLTQVQETEVAAAQSAESAEAELERLRAEIAEERVRQEAENYRREQEIEMQITQLGHSYENTERIEQLQQELEATRQHNLAMQEQFAHNESQQLNAAMARIHALEAEKEQKRLRAMERRRETNAKRREILSRENIDRHINKYFVEISACFLMDREAYKDRFGISPYNRIIVNESGETTRVRHVMTNTQDKIYRFAETLIDVETFMRHPYLFRMYIDLVGEGTSLVRISEKLHLKYLQDHRKDFVKDYRYKEDFENLLVLASHHYVLSGMNFADMFGAPPFDPNTATDNEIAAYLDNDQIKHTFTEYFPNYADLGFEDMYQALAISFFAAQKDWFTPERLVGVILKEGERVARELRRLNKPGNKAKQAKMVGGMEIETNAYQEHREHHEPDNESSPDFQYQEAHQINQPHHEEQHQTNQEHHYEQEIYQIAPELYQNHEQNAQQLEQGRLYQEQLAQLQQEIEAMAQANPDNPEEDAFSYYGR